jgi:hypothetical protein
MPDDEPNRDFIAYQLHERVPMDLVTAPLERDWMNLANQRFPYRCLPLNIANQHGWFATCPCDFDLYWYGGPALSDLELRFPAETPPNISSHFGYGVLTFSLPFLFRTPPGVNLWVKGPTNMPKDGIAPLEGIVETDWATSTFTMNWKVTRPFEWISFRHGEPVCMVVPVARGLLESLTPILRPIIDDPEVNAQYLAWNDSRRSFLKGLGERDPATVQRGWQKDYFQGKTGDGTFTGHQTRVDLKEFAPRPQEPRDA